jgi:hypothetical protein
MSSYLFTVPLTKWSCGGLLVGLYTHLSRRTIQWMVSILANSLARQELLLRTGRKQKEGELYFSVSCAVVRELGQLNIHLELLTAAV